MLIAHLPAGYLCTTVLINMLPVPQARRATFLRIGLIASVLPDFDMLYFYLVDRQQHLHHTYITHWSAFWLAIMLVGLIASWPRRQQALAIGALILGCNTLLHCVLDSVTGSIHWLEPFANDALTLVEVPARYEPWFVNFLLYWTFALELAIVLAALVVWIKQRRTANTWAA